MRLRAIEVSRNLAATSFYQEELNLQNDQSTTEINNGPNSHNGSVDNALIENGLSRSSSVANSHSREIELTHAKIHLQLEQFLYYYYWIQHPQQHVQTPPQSMMVNEQADADDEADDWLSLIHI